MTKHLFSCLLLASFLYTSSTMAQEEAVGTAVLDEGLNMDVMEPDQIEKSIKGKTLWPQENGVRAYFSNDNTYEFYNGSTLTKGLWKVSGDQLCFENEQTPDKEECYLGLLGDDTMRPWGQYDDPVLFIPVPDFDEKGQAIPKESLPLNRWMQGNLMLTPAYMKDQEKDFAKIKSIKENNETTDNIHEMNNPDPSLAEYIQDISGSVSIYPFGGMYHSLDNQVMTLTEDEVKILKENPTTKALPSRGFEGKWFINGHQQCWIATVVVPPMIDCQSVYKSQDIMLHPQKGVYATHMDDGFTRLLKPNDIFKLKQE